MQARQAPPCLPVQFPLTTHRKMIKSSIKWQMIKTHIKWHRAVFLRTWGWFASSSDPAVISSCRGEEKWNHSGPQVKSAVAKQTARERSPNHQETHSNPHPTQQKQGAQHGLRRWWWKRNEQSYLECRKWWPSRLSLPGLEVWKELKEWPHSGK